LSLVDVIKNPKYQEQGSINAPVSTLALAKGSKYILGFDGVYTPVAPPWILASTKEDYRP
jgi:hypothetical protein